MAERAHAVEVPGGAAVTCVVTEREGDTGWAFIYVQPPVPA